MVSGFWRLVMLSSLHLFAVQLTMPLLSSYFALLGFSEAWIFFVFGLFPLTVMLLSSTIGELSESFSRSWMIRIAFFLQAGAYLIYFSGHAWGIVLARLVDAAAFVAVEAMILAKVQDMVSEEHRGRFTGAKLSVETLLRMLAPVAGGFIADIYVGAPFFLSIGLFIALALSIKHTSFRSKAPLHARPLREIRSFLSHPQLLPMAVLGVAMHALVPLYLVSFPLYVLSLGLSLVHVGLLATTYAFGSVFQFFFGDVSDRIGRRKLVIFGSLVKVGCLAAIGFLTPQYGLLIFLLVGAGFGAAVWNVTAWTHMSSVAEVEHRSGRVIGTYISISSVGMVFSYFSLSVFSSLLSFSSLVFVFSGFVFVAICVSALLFVRAHVASTAFAKES